MYSIIKDGEVIAAVPALQWVRRQENGVYIRAGAADGQGVLVDGNIYGIRGGVELPGVDAVDIVETEDRDTGAERVEALERTTASQEAVMVEVWAAAGAYVATATDLTDAQVLAVPSLVKTWEQALAAGEKLAFGTVIQKDGVIYRVAQEGGVVPQAHQVPGGDGMLAVYRPIDKDHAGTIDDPIPWVYGMDCFAGKYYTYNGDTYKVTAGGDMIPCTWPPDSPGLWQWEKV